MDDFNQESSSFTDGTTWIDDTLEGQADNPDPNYDAECFDFDDDSSWDACWAVDNATDSACYSYSSTQINEGRGYYLKCGGSGDVWENCSLGNVGNYHDLNTTGSIGQKRLKVVVYQDCDNSSGSRAWDTKGKNYYIINKKRAFCTGTNTHDYQGWHSAGWQTYKLRTCLSEMICDATLDEQNISTKNGIIPDPCVFSGQVCNGTITSIVLNSRNEPIYNAKIYKNGIYNGSTDFDGVFVANVSAACNSAVNISVYCNDSITLCGTKSTSMDTSVNDTDSLTFNCNICNNRTDLYISSNDIRLRNQSTQTNISVSVHVEKVNVNNLIINFKGTRDSVVTFDQNITVSSISAYTDFNVSILKDLSSTNTVHVYVDVDNKVQEFDLDAEQNNYASKNTIPLIKAYLDVSTGDSAVDTVIKNYLSQYVDSISQGEAEVIISVGNAFFNSLVNSNNLFTKLNYGWSYDLVIHKVVYNNKLSDKAYNGIVGAFSNSGVNRIFAYGTEIEGTIASVKRLVETRETYFNNLNIAKSTYLENSDVKAIAAYDFFHTSENEPVYKNGGSEFATIVEKFLNGDVGTTSIKHVLTYNTNTSLRLKNVNADYSERYKNFSSLQPVVMSRGIHSNLYTWLEFGQELVEDGKDVWLIEMVGGPGTDEECVNCPNYTFSDLKTYYWPALIAGVEAYSGNHNLSYVGFSMGCSAALESLELYGSTGKNNAGYARLNNQWQLVDMSANVVDTFVAVACPGNFSKLTVFLDSFNDTWKSINDSYNEKNLHHITIDQLKRSILIRNPLLLANDLDINILTNVLVYLIPFSDEKMSKSIYDAFYGWINDPEGPRIGQNVNINNFAIIQGNIINTFASILLPLANAEGTDFVVTSDDQKEICKNVNSNNKNYLSLKNKFHIGPSRINIPDGELTKEIINEFLNNKGIITQEYKNLYLISNQTNCES